MTDRALYSDFTYGLFRDSAFRDTAGLVGLLPAEVPDNLVSAFKLVVRDEEDEKRVAYNIWVHVYDLAHYPNFQAGKGIPRFIYEADVYIQRDSDEGPSVNLKYAVKSPLMAIDTARTIWISLGCPTHV